MSSSDGIARYRVPARQQTIQQQQSSSESAFSLKGAPRAPQASGTLFQRLTTTQAPQLSQDFSSQGLASSSAVVQQQEQQTQEEEEQAPAPDTIQPTKGGSAPVRNVQEVKAAQRLPQPDIQRLQPLRPLRPLTTQRPTTTQRPFVRINLQPQPQPVQQVQQQEEFVQEPLVQQKLETQQFEEAPQILCN